MRHYPDRQRSRALQCEVLPGGHAVHRVRYRSGVFVSLGGGVPRVQDGGFCRDADLHGAGAGRVLLRVEEGRARLVGRRSFDCEASRPEEPMTLAEALEPFARSSSERLGELTVEIAPEKLVETCRLLKTDWKFERLSTVTAVDRYPSEP